MLGRRLKKLILIRLLFATLLLYGPVVLPAEPEVVFYGAAAFICLTSFIYFLWYLTKRRLRWLAFIQLYFDILLEGAMVYGVGGAESLFASLFVLSILSSALIVGEKSFVYQYTALTCLVYSLASLAFFYHKESATVFRDPVYFYYSLSLRIAIFVIVGQLARYLSQTVLDLQERLKLSERLSLLGEIVSKISHEIRNPLSAIQTAAEVLKDSLQGKLNPQEERMVSIVYQESARLTGTLERILGYAKELRPNPRMLLVDNLVERALALVRLRSELHPQDISVEKVYDPNYTKIYADEEQAVGAILNVTLNAYQAMPHGGVFRIAAVEELTGTKLDLEDTGGGIPPERLKDLFLPFKSSKKGGTGLGLAEVHKVVTLHEGKIDVEPHPGKGTVFHLFFPKP